MKPTTNQILKLPSSRCRLGQPSDTAAGVLSLVKMVQTVAQQKYNRLAYTESVDEVDEKKENLLAKVEAMLAQKIEQTKLITFHWSIV